MLATILTATIFAASPAAGATTCVPTAELATAVGPAYVRAQPGVVAVPSQRYYEESYAAGAWLESNGVAGLQTTSAEGCGAPPDTTVGGSDERAYASLLSFGFGARACVTRTSGVLLPAHYCPIVGA